MTTDAAGAGEPRYDLALICGDGDREYVDKVYEHLKERGVRAYLHGHEDLVVELWGGDLPVILDRVIRGEIRFAVVFVSRHLTESLPAYQRRLALDRLLAIENTFVLPVRMDDAGLAGFPLATTGTVDGRQLPAAEVARLLVLKLRGGAAGGAAAPRVELRVERDPGRPPRAVVLRNTGPVPIAGCTYVARLADPLELRAWYLTPPRDLAPGAQARHVPSAAHGVERANYVLHDTTVDARLRTQRLTVLVAVRAFASEEAAGGELRGTPERDGCAFPPASLFAAEAAAEPEGDVEAVVFRTADGRLHRLLPHVSAAIWPLDPDVERPAWAAWYERTVRRPPLPPAAVTGALPPPLALGRRPFPR